jgi:RNA polymerase sigma factor (sigma-70 family)
MMADQPSDEEQLQAWLTRHCMGEHPPFNDLCSICQDRLRKLVRSRLRYFPEVRRDVQTTEILDDTLMKLLAALRTTTLTTVFDLNCFLASIIRRVLLDRVRKLQRNPTINLTAPDAIAVEERTIFDVDTMAALHEAVENAPTDIRVLFDLIYYSGMTTEQAAGQLGHSVSKVKRDWLKARDRIREQIGFDVAEPLSDS